MHEEWKGGNMELYPGGGHKLNLLPKEIELVKNETDLVVMFTDRYGVHSSWLAVTIKYSQVVISFKIIHFVLCFTRSYDVVFAAGADEILKKFLTFKAKVVISAEGFLWPDKTLLVIT